MLPLNVKEYLCIDFLKFGVRFVWKDKFDKKNFGCKNLDLFFSVKHKRSCHNFQIKSQRSIANYVQPKSLSTYIEIQFFYEDEIRFFFAI